MLMQLLRGGWSLPNILMTILVYAVLLLVVFPVHEMAHGFAAYLLGDKTAKYQGRLTMNPLAHMDPFGSLMMLLVGVGYAKPVPVNPYNFKNRKAGMALTALAGPLSNLLMAILSVGLYRVLIIFVSDGWTLTLLHMGLVELFASINILLAMFNLLPILPLDGGRGLYFLLTGLLDGALADRALRLTSAIAAGLLLGAGLVLGRQFGNLTLLITSLWLSAGLFRSWRWESAAQ